MSTGSWVPGAAAVGARSGMLSCTWRCIVPPRPGGRELDLDRGTGDVARTRLAVQMPLLPVDDGSGGGAPRLVPPTTDLEAKAAEVAMRACVELRSSSGWPTE